MRGSADGHQFDGRDNRFDEHGPWWPWSDREPFNRRRLLVAYRTNQTEMGSLDAPATQTKPQLASTVGGVARYPRLQGNG